MPGRLIFDDVAMAHRLAGGWARWDPGYLLLRIDASGDGKIEPIFIDGADGALTAMSGYLENTRPYDETGSAVEDAAIAAAQVDRLVEQWLCGDLRTAVHYRADGEWCSSIAVESPDVELQLRHATSELRDFAPARIELRSPARED